MTLTEVLTESRWYSGDRLRSKDKMLRRILARLALAVAVAAVMAVPPGLAVDIDYPHLFGTAETRSDNLKPFTKWTGVLGRIQADRTRDAGPCAPASAPRCRVQEWRAFLDTLAGKPKHAQVEAVNRHMNRYAYIEDLPNYGVPDYWATPREFFSKDGDCEDYAIAKYMSLRQLGFAESQLRLVVLQDLNLNVAHAVLVVYLDGKAWLLDNQIKQVIETEKVRHYRPLFSINERSWWLHKRIEPQFAGGARSTPAPTGSGPSSAR